MSKAAVLLRLLRPEHLPIWSIGIYRGESPLALQPLAGPANPVLRPRDIPDVRAETVADPFMVRRGGTWFVFFEVLVLPAGRGEIGLAVSTDLMHWEYQGIALREPFHLSYPHVWEWEGSFYMTPEAAAGGTVRLYRADPFPLRWRLVGHLIHEPILDPTPFPHSGSWWMFGHRGSWRDGSLALFMAQSFTGPWREHPASPILAGAMAPSRPAGRVVLRPDGTPLRFGQVSSRNYGEAVRAFVLTKLTPTEYAEGACLDAPILSGSGRGWNATGMHHVDSHHVGPGDWIAAVDGRRTQWRLPLLRRLSRGAIFSA